MDIKQIRQYLKLMETNGLAEFELQDGDTKIKLVKTGADQVNMIPAAMPAMGAMGAMGAPAIAPTGDAGAPAASANAEEVKSPMVGTFYRAPAPGADNFVEVGSRIEKGSVICIVEAMKVMNEIKSEVSGIVKDILVDNGEPVEYNQPMFLVEPA